MKQTVILIFTLFYFNCSTNQNSNNIDSVISEKHIIDTSKEIVENLKLEKDTPDFKSLDSPVGLIVETSFASTTDDYHFYDDSIVALVFENNSDDWWLGKWYMEGDTIVMNFSKSVYERGIGKPIYSDGVISAGGPNVEYAEYVYDVQTINKTYKDSWKEIKSSLNKENYEILNWDIKYDPEKYDRQLTGKYSIASERKLEKADLAGYSKKELRLMRNEIFARYGFKFKSKDLFEYFSGTGWYEPMRDNVALYLSDLEKENISLIESLEKNK